MSQDEAWYLHIYHALSGLLECSTNSLAGSSSALAGNVLLLEITGSIIVGMPLKGYSLFLIKQYETRISVTKEGSPSATCKIIPFVQCIATPVVIQDLCHCYPIQM